MASSNQYILYIVGLLLLLHSGYSSFEFHKFIIHNNSINSINSPTNLPLDISIEAIIGFIIILIGSIISIENSNYLSIENKIIKEEFKYLKSINLSDSFQIGEKIGIGEFEELNSRLPFIDIVKIRNDYSKWVNEEKK